MTKTLCIPEMVKNISDNIVLGLSNKDACANAGIDESTFYKWIRRGLEESERVSESKRRKVRKREAPFVQFVQSIKRAIPKRKQILIGRIQQAAKGGNEYTETFKKYRGGELVEERITVKQRAPEWTAAAWLLERIHYDEFGRRQRLDVYDWHGEVKRLLDSGAVTQQDVLESLGNELAREFFESVGLDFVGVGAPAEEETSDAI